MENKDEPKKEEEEKKISRCTFYLEPPIEIILTENSKLTVKDLYNTYWRCRDFEITHLWQRSVFLTAFLVLCFSAYGILGNSIIDILKDVTFIKKSPISWFCINFLALAISMAGIVLSCLWIMMAKGSKAWYEIYENAIGAYEKDVSHYEKGDKTFEEIAGFNYANQKGYEKLDFDQEFKSGKGGAYSPSKINWAIGFFMLKIWRYLIKLQLGFLLLVAIYLLFKVQCWEWEKIPQKITVDNISLSIGYIVLFCFAYKCLNVQKKVEEKKGDLESATIKDIERRSKDNGHR